MFSMCSTRRLDERTHKLCGIDIGIHDIIAGPSKSLSGALFVRTPPVSAYDYCLGTRL